MCSTCCDSAWFSSVDTKRRTFNWSFILGNVEFAEGRVRCVGGVGNSDHVIFCHEFPHSERGVCRRIVMVQQPVSVLPHLRPFVPHIFPQSQNLAVKIPIDSLTRWNKLLMHNSSIVKKIMNIDLMLLQTWHTFFGRGEDGVFHCEDCCFVSGS